MQTSDKKRGSPEKRRTNAKTPRAAFFIAIASIITITVLACAFLAYTVVRARAPEYQATTAAEKKLAVETYQANHTSSYPFQDAPELVPYAVTADKGTLSVDLSDSDITATINAKAAILVDATTGEVLFEKNADEQIPPASMTKLVAMYTAFRAIKAGEITLDDVVPLPPDSWAVNIPAGSSLMFLGAGQKVTVRELLVGMAVASGNDAAIALAHHVSGSVEAFVARMNAEVKELGLAKTHFEEPSGLSEKNLTTAREFANFALVYIREYPEALTAFHSVEKIEYPMPWNLPEGSRETPVIQYATNKLLNELPGCDGLKTGFIHESGYNLALTVLRSGTRFISVTMGGSGSSSSGGSEIRSEDGRNLMEWAFAHFKTQKNDSIAPQAITVWGGTPGGVVLVPAGHEHFTMPSANGSTVETRVELAPSVTAPIHAGDRLGSVTYYIDGKKAHVVPLVADRDIARASLAKRIPDMTARLLSRLLDKIKD